ncbi:transposase [Halomonas kashgarensis]|uniref:transposase n=1 Tax=Halomonas kashgarensis TaxID=3084920 RepID=UPI003A8D2F5C
MVIGAVSLQGRSYFSWAPGTVTGATIVTFLKTLLRYWRGKLRIIWDNAPVHRCREVREWLRQPDVQARLSLEPLPPYVPVLNPTESLWSWIKRKRATLTFKDALGLGQWLKRTTSWIKRRHDHVRKLMKASPVHLKLMGEIGKPTEPGGGNSPALAGLYLGRFQMCSC